MKEKLSCGVNPLTASAAAALTCLLIGCGSKQGEPEDPTVAGEDSPTPPSGEGVEPSDHDADLGDPAEAGPELHVPLIPKSESSISGYVELTETVKGVHVKVLVRDAEPGLHGVHIHEVADCSAPDGKSAGGHFNPAENPHGIPDKADEHHLGDLGNITIDSDGSGTLEHAVRYADLSEGGEMSFRGRGLIVHADPDTGEQPTGGSGARVACAELTEEAAAVARATADDDVD